MECILQATMKTRNEATNRDVRRYSYEKGIGIIFGIDLYVVISCL